MNRSLPAEIPVAGRNEAQSAAERVQGRLRQAFDHGLAVIALSALAHDEQMTRWPESVFERLTPDHFDRVGLDSIPCRDVAACNIRWVKLNDGRKNACQVAGWFSSPLTHD